MIRSAHELRLAYHRGREASRTGVKLDECPYDGGDFRKSWVDGYNLETAERVNRRGDPAAAGRPSARK